MADTETVPVETTPEAVEKTEETPAAPEAEVKGEAKTEEVKEEETAKEEDAVPKEDEAEKADEGGAAADATAEGEAPAADAVVQEPKEEVPPKVILHQFPPGKHIPSLSPYCLKLETFLRLNKIPYENQYSYKMGKKGKMPWIEYKGERKADSSFIIDYLTETFEVSLDSELSDSDKALGRIAKVALEENTTNALQYYRYLDNFVEFKKLIAPVSAGIGFNVSLKMTQRKVRNMLDGQGMGRHLKEEVYQIAKEDIKATSVLLGEKDFLLGDKPTSYDCTLFGLFANILLAGLESPLSTFINEEAQNIVAYVNRVKELCWADWVDMVQGEKPEPTIKKGFSFRKKKAAKPAKAKEAESPEEETKEGEDGEKKEEETPAETPAKENAEEKAEQKSEEVTEEATEKPAEETTVTDKLDQPTQNGGADASLIKAEE